MKKLASMSLAAVLSISLVSSAMAQDELVKVADAAKQAQDVIAQKAEDGKKIIAGAQDQIQAALDQNAQGEQAMQAPAVGGQEKYIMPPGGGGGPRVRRW